MNNFNCNFKRQLYRCKRPSRYINVNKIRHLLNSKAMHFYTNGEKILIMKIEKLVGMLSLHYQTA